MDLSVDKNTVFIAGASYKDKSGRSDGTLVALNFDKKLKILKETSLTEHQIQACTAMQRVADKDDLVVGCFKHMLIYRYEAKKFIMMQKLKYVHTSNPSLS